MRNLLIVIVAFSLFSFLLISCETKEASEKKEEHMESDMQSGVQYTCPMHPEVLSDKPGACPKCGMDLEKKTTQENMSPMFDSTGHADSSMKM